MGGILRGNDHQIKTMEPPNTWMYGGSNRYQVLSVIDRTTDDVEQLVGDGLLTALVVL